MTQTESRGVIRAVSGGVEIAITVVPRASRCEIAGVQNEMLKVKLTSPPAEGKANAQCIEFIAKCLGIAKSQIAIIQGKNSRRKVLKINGVTEKEVREKIIQ